MYGLSFSFDVALAVEFGLHAAILYNILACAPCDHLSEGYLKAAIGSIMNDKEIKKALKSLKDSNKIGEVEHAPGRFYLTESGK